MNINLQNLSKEELQQHLAAVQLAIDNANKAEYKQRFIQFTNDLKDSQKSFDVLKGSVEISEIWKDVDLKKLAKGLGLKPIEKKQKTDDAATAPADGSAPKVRKARSLVSDEDVFEFIKSNGKVIVKQIVDNFSKKTQPEKWTSPATINSYLKKLQAAGRIDRKPESNKVYVSVKSTT